MSSDPIDRLEQLERLVRLRDANALSAAEFEAEKRKVLTGGHVPAAPAAPVPVPSPAPYLPDAGVDAPVGKPWLGTLIRWALAVAIISAVLAYFFINTTPTTVDRKPALSHAATQDRLPTPHPTSQPLVLDNYVRATFSEKDGCDFGEEGNALFSQLLSKGDPNHQWHTAVSIEIGDVRLVPSFVKDKLPEGEVRYTGSVLFPKATSFHNIKVVSLVTDYDSVPESDAGGLTRQIILAASPKQIIEAIKEYGFHFVADESGDYSIDVGDEANSAASLQKLGNGRTALVCG